MSDVAIVVGVASVLAGVFVVLAWFYPDHVYGPVVGAGVPGFPATATPEARETGLSEGQRVLVPEESVPSALLTFFGSEVADPNGYVTATVEDPVPDQDGEVLLVTEVGMHPLWVDPDDAKTPTDS